MDLGREHSCQKWVKQRPLGRRFPKKIHLSRMETTEITRNPTEQLRAAVSEIGDPLSDGSVEKVLFDLDETIDALDRGIEELVAGSEDLAESYGTLTSVPGIGPVAAAALIAWMSELGAIGNRQAAALVGVVSFARHSGTL